MSNNRMSWMPLALQRATSWEATASEKVSSRQILHRPTTFNCESDLVNKEKPLPPTPPYATLNFAVDELFLPTSDDYCQSPIPTTSSSTSSFVEFCQIHEASLIMPLRDFLNWIHNHYNISALTTQFKRRSPLFSHLPKDHYHDLLGMEAQYDSTNLTDNSGASRAALHAIHTTLSHLRQELEQDFVYLDRKHASMRLRDFVMWTYCKFKPKQGRRSFRQSMLWNPHQITSSTRVVKEAVSYFSSRQFEEDRGVLCIHAKHIVYLLSGGKDWRESVRPDDALIVRHAEPM